MRPPSTLLLALLAVTTLAAGAAHAQPAADAASIRKLDSLWARMYARHDTAAAIALYADDLIFTSANGAQKSKAQELADVRPQPGLVMDYFRTAPTQVRTFDGTGVVTGVAEWRFAMSGGPPREVRRAYTAVYARGGPLGWRLVAVHMGNSPQQ